MSKKVTELGYHDRKAYLNATVSISKQFTNGYGISSDAESVDQSYAGELTKRQYDCMYAYYFENKTQAQIAKELGIGAPTVNKHMKKQKNVYLRSCAILFKGLSDRKLIVFM